MSFVSLDIEGGICVDDLRDVIYCPGIIEGMRGHQRKVGTVPDVCVLRGDGEKAKTDGKQARLT
jgi:hypothetical protein